MPKVTPQATRTRRIRRAVGAGVLALLALAARPAGDHARAASLLLRFADEHAQGSVADFGRHVVDEEPATIDAVGGPARARAYVPRGVQDPPGVVLVHGVHRLGIDEPRLRRFARAIASSGVVVLTPEVQEIADYHVDPRSVDTIGAAARTLRTRLGAGKAGVMGMSFAGGLSLIAAADPRFAADIGFVVAVGAHHDLARVSRFFATSRVEHPDGSTTSLDAHGYGALVMVYGHAGLFFPPEDVPIAEDTLRLWLWDQRAEARARAEALSPESWAKMDLLLDGPRDALAPEMLAQIERARATMDAVSPAGRLAAMRVPVFLLHGAGDTVIPAGETEWIASQVPPELLRQALVSPAIVHVEIEGKPPLSQQWDLVHFMAAILAEARAARG
jgi:pimeloyl-ACP methyl ester carboxylesterase